MKYLLGCGISIGPVLLAAIRGLQSGVLFEAPERQETSGGATEHLVRGELPK